MSETMTARRKADRGDMARQVKAEEAGGSLIIVAHTRHLDIA